jgi:hypothetical protein
MRLPEGATAPSTARQPRSSPPASRPAPVARSSGASHPDLFAPALSQAGLKSFRVIYVEDSDENSPALRKACSTAAQAPLWPEVA